MTPQKYRKLPVIIEAWQFHSQNVPETDAIAKWILDNGGNARYWFKDKIQSGGVGLTIKTWELNIFDVSDGDYIIRGIKGEFYACKKDIFQLTYELVEE